MMGGRGGVIMIREEEGRGGGEEAGEGCGC